MAAGCVLQEQEGERANNQVLSKKSDESLLATGRSSKEVLMRGLL